MKEEYKSHVDISDENVENFQFCVREILYHGFFKKYPLPEKSKNCTKYKIVLKAFNEICRVVLIYDRKEEVDKDLRFLKNYYVMLETLKTDYDRTSFWKFGRRTHLRRQIKLHEEDAISMIIILKIAAFYFILYKLGDEQDFQNILIESMNFWLGI